MKKIITSGFALFAMLFLLACSESPQQPSEPEVQAQSETERFNIWLDEQYEEMLARSPMQLTTMGRKDRYHELDDMSAEGEAQELAHYESMVQTMRATFDYAALEQDAQLSWDLIEYSLERQQQASEFNKYRYIFNQMQGAHTGLVQFMIAYHRVDTAADMEAYIARLHELGRAISQLTERAQASAEQGIRPPRFAYETVIMETRGVVTGQPFDNSDRISPLWSDVNNKVDALLANETINAETAETLKQQAALALNSSVKPTYTALADWLASDIDNTLVNPVGVSRHEGGLAYYQDRLKQHTTTDLTADEIHQIGLAEVARIRNQMEAIQAQMGFEGSFTEFFEFMRTDEQFFYPNNDEGRQGYIDDSTAYINAITEKLPEYFGILPKADLVVKRVEAYREQDGAAQHYSRGTPDGSRPGVYYAHLSDMTSMPKTDMEAIAYHEGNPGHHMQISIAQELENVPKFRTVMGFTVFIEGWALYAEELAKEMGGYQELYSEFGRLGSEIWRAVRLVVDTGMHAKGWTEEQAFDYFMAHVPTAEASARSEIQRYLVIPGQATSYKMGMIKILELRAQAEEALGDNFDIRGFHDTVLGGGALPLPLLERRVQQWVDSQR